MKPAWQIWLRRLLPWGVTVGVIALLLHRYPAAAIEAEMAKGNAFAVIPFALAAVIESLAFVSASDWLVFRASLGHARWRDVLVGKAGTSVLMALGYGLGAGGYGVWLARKTGASARTTIGMIAYVMVSDLTALSLIATTAVWLAGDALDPRARAVLGFIAPAIAIAMTLAALLGPRLLRRFVRDPQLFRPWTSVPATVFAANLAIRIVNLATAMALTWGAAQAFGLDVPAWAMATYLPVLFFVGALPINVAGFGAVQLAWVELFSRWAPGERILAFQFLFHLMTTAFLILRGLPFVGRISREIATSSATPDKPGAPPPAASPGSSST